MTLETGKRMIKRKTGGTFLSIIAGYTHEGSGFVCPSACAKAGVENLMKLAKHMSSMHVITFFYCHIIS